MGKIGKCGNLDSLQDVKRIGLESTDKGEKLVRMLTDSLPEGTRNPPDSVTLSELEPRLRYQTDTSAEGLPYKFCRKSSSLYSYRFYCDRTHLMTLQGLAGIELDADEVELLRELGGPLLPGDVCQHEKTDSYMISRNNYVLKQIIDKLRSPGKHELSRDVKKEIQKLSEAKASNGHKNRLDEIVYAIENLPTMTEKSRIEESLEMTRKQLELGVEQSDRFLWALGVPVLTSLLLTVPLLWIFRKQLGLTREGLFQQRQFFEYNRDAMDRQFGLMEQTVGEHAKIDGSDVPASALYVNAVEKQLSEYRTDGVFEMPYIDRDGLIEKILDITGGAQKDTTNYLSVGPSRAGKTATTEYGLAQAIIYAEMNAEDRGEMLEKVAGRLTPEEAQIYKDTLEKNAKLINDMKAELEVRGFKVISVSLGDIVAKGAVWEGKKESFFDKPFEEARQFVEAGYHVIMLFDEGHQAQDGDPLRGRIPLIQHLKKRAEEHKRLSLAIATTVDEYKIIAKDRALVNRFLPVFHPAASPEKTVDILSLKPYIKGRYQVDHIDPQAMKAAYLMGIHVDMLERSSHTAAEVFFEDVLKKARRDGRTSVDLDYVSNHYEKYYSELHGENYLTADNIDKWFEHENHEISEQNVRDRAQLRQAVAEAAGPIRVTEKWSAAAKAELRGQAAPQGANLFEGLDGSANDFMRAEAKSLLDVMRNEESLKWLFVDPDPNDNEAVERRNEQRLRIGEWLYVNLLDEAEHHRITGRDGEFKPGAVGRRVMKGWTTGEIARYEAQRSGKGADGRSYFDSMMDFDAMRRGARMRARGK